MKFYFMVFLLPKFFRGKQVLHILGVLTVAFNTVGNSKLTGSQTLTLPLTQGKHVQRTIITFTLSQLNPYWLGAG
ncbi:hypothetical protein [Algoriphagus jejuensis]|uniref:hypothetical protein n=1 Tax=Algoriphagus jejuensis TaxID=419934 RepID=UPI0031DA7CF9